MTNPTVDHSADGTLVHGTVRGDREVTAVLKANGFRWSRNLEAWYLPRTWTEQTRWGRVDRLREQLGERISVERSDAPRGSAAEREAERRERAGARSVRLDERADRAEERSTAAAAKADQISEGIPLGQPVLVGHHSQRRHERDLERIQNATEASITEDRYARDLRAAAERARAVADGNESIVTIGNRIESDEADLRGVRRRLGETAADGDHRARLERREAELVDQIAHDRTKIARAGGFPYSRENVKPGDFVQVGGNWYPVIRSNAKTASLPNAVFGADSDATRTTPWRNIKGHLRREETTPEQVRELAETTSPGFPGVRDRLLREVDTMTTDNTRERYVSTRRPGGSSVKNAAADGTHASPTRLERSTRMADKTSQARTAGNAVEPPTR